MDLQFPRVKVVIEIPRGSFLKRGLSGHIDFISPLPCPFNYGAVPDYIGGDEDLLDAVVLGPRLRFGESIEAIAYGAVGLTDRGIYDDKLICSQRPLRPMCRQMILSFFHFYAFCKRLLNFFRGELGRTICEGWEEAESAILRARPRRGTKWNGPFIRY